MAPHTTNQEQQGRRTTATTPTPNKRVPRKMTTRAPGLLPLVLVLVLPGREKRARDAGFFISRVFSRTTQTTARPSEDGRRLCLFPLEGRKGSRLRPSSSLEPREKQQRQGFWNLSPSPETRDGRTTQASPSLVSPLGLFSLRTLCASSRRCRLAASADSRPSHLATRSSSACTVSRQKKSKFHSSTSPNVCSERASERSGRQ